MKRILNQMKLQASMSNEYSNPIIGFVSSYDKNNYCCKITIFPDDPITGNKAIVSGWIPVGSVWVGNGWGLFCPPTVGDMVEVDFQEGDFEAGHCDWRFYNDINRPVTAESGVFYVIHKSGSCIKFENNGSVLLQAHTNLTCSAPNGVLRLEGQTVKVHASNTYQFDANGQGQKWNGTSVSTWNDNDVAGSHSNHAPPEIP